MRVEIHNGTQQRASSDQFRNARRGEGLYSTTKPYLLESCFCLIRFKELHEPLRLRSGLLVSFNTAMG